MEEYIQRLQGLLEDASVLYPKLNFGGSGGNATQLLKSHAKDEKKAKERLDIIKQLVGGARPRVQIRFQDLKVSFRARITGSKDIPSVWSQLVSGLLGMIRPAERFESYALHGVSGVIKPGTMNLVLGPPNSGKSTLLKALAGLLLNYKASRTTGSITYNGTPIQDSDFFVRKVAGFISDNDSHLASLSVEETLDFACDTLGGERTRIVGSRHDPHNARSAKVHALLTLLGLEGNIASTKIGDEMVRGVSGGQKRRVTLGEMLAGMQSIYFGNEISTGLDSTTTLEIVRAMRLMSDEFNCTFVLSLLQCNPEVFALFDNVIILVRGRIIYQGPPSLVLDHFETLGGYDEDITNVRNKSLDIATFLEEVTSLEKHTLDQLVEHYSESEVAARVKADLEVTVEKSQFPEQYCQQFSRSWLYNTHRCAARHWKIIVRDRSFRARMSLCVLGGLLGGSVWWQLEETDFVSRFGLLFFVAIFMSLGSIGQLPVNLMSRNVFYKQNSAGFYPGSAYTLGMALAVLPMSVFEVALFGPSLYWMSGCAAEAVRFGLFLLISALLSACMLQLMRLIACIASKDALAISLASLSLFMFLLTSGFIIPRNTIPRGWAWLYNINPFAHAFRGLALNEFQSSKYNRCVLSGTPCVRSGDAFLNAFDIDPTGSAWVPVAILVAWYLISLFLSALSIGFFRFDRQTFSVRRVLQKDVQEPENGSSIPEPVPLVLAFDGLSFSVDSTVGGVKEQYQILSSADGYISPGTMTALIGPSGCGKTTLLDILACRKTKGTVQGKIVFNGRMVGLESGLPRDEVFQRMRGYVEQYDSLPPLSTTREALEFTAALALSHYTPEQRAGMIQTLLTQLDLWHLETRLIGVPGQEGSLPLIDRKRLSVALEMVSNPSILFLDEPTSGLDTLDSEDLMQVVKYATMRGNCPIMSVVCTIHQPSDRIFSLFDNVMVLGQRGHQVYFGPVSQCVAHFESIPGVQLRTQASPAAFILDTISSSTTANKKGVIAFESYYRNSALCAENDREIDELCEVDDAFECDESFVAPPLRLQYTKCLMRALKSYWRSPSYNLTRMFVCIAIGTIVASFSVRKPVRTQQDISTIMSMIFLTSLFLGGMNILTVIPMSMAERAVFVRERANRLYGVLPYVLAYTLAEIPYVICSIVLFVNVFYWMLGLRGSSEHYLFYLSFLTLFATFCTFLGQLIASMVRTRQMGLVTAAIPMYFMSLFCGFLVLPFNIPRFVKKKKKAAIG
eukprot:c12453_g1_i1.p1 GENE.c12453_g1_i1~~c12453_g1_i1.p1  ORF type:complete len:1324 (-),score=341.35 c12453_g1_i1:397-4131(-)